MTTFGSLESVDEALSEGGRFKPLTEWWRGTLKRFYESDANTIVARVGRGGAKSHTSVKIALAEVLAGDWQVPEGERHFWGYVSTSVSEAAQRLALLESFLQALNISYDRQGDEIALRSSRLGWKVFAANVGAVSGFRCVGYSLDEAAKILHASEIVASLNAMCVTHPNARKLLISSPMSGEGYHDQRFDEGDGNGQIVASAASWIANPDGASEETCRRAERNPRIFAREFGVVPSTGDAAFEDDDLSRAFVQRDDATMTPMAAKFGLVDLSSGKHDGACAAMASWRADKRTGQPLLHVYDVEAYAAPFDPKKTLKAITHFFFRHGHSFEIYGDAHESWALIQALEGRRKIKFTELRTTSSSKQAAVARIQGWLSNGTLLLPNSALAKSQMATFATSDGRKFAARGKSAHDDFVSLLVAAATADEKGLLHGSPNDYTPQTAMRQACVKAAAMDRAHKGSGAGRLQLSEWVLNKVIRVQ